MVRILLERSKFSLETGKNLIMRDISNAVDLTRNMKHFDSNYITTPICRKIIKISRALGFRRTSKYLFFIIGAHLL